MFNYNIEGPEQYEILLYIKSCDLQHNTTWLFDKYLFRGDMDPYNQLKSRTLSTYGPIEIFLFLYPHKNNSGSSNFYRSCSDKCPLMYNTWLNLLYVNGDPRVYINIIPTVVQRMLLLCTLFLRKTRTVSVDTPLRKDNKKGPFFLLWIVKPSTDQGTSQ